MLAMKVKRNLFGGALRSAGLASATIITSSATADFAPVAPLGDNNILQVFGDSTGSAYVHQFAYNTSPAFNPAQGYFGPGLVMVAYANSTAMGVSLTLTDADIWDQYASSLAVQLFTVKNTKQVIFEWDMSNAAASYGLVYQVGYGNVSPVATPFTTGSALLTLMPGETYKFVGYLILTGVEGGGYIRLANVPAPGALGLLGVGLLTTCKRRRRE